MTNKKLIEIALLSAKYKRLTEVPFPSAFARICLPYVPLHAFATSEGTKCFYQGHRHFSGYDSATCHIADDLRGELDMVSTLLRLCKIPVFFVTVHITPYQ